MLRGVSRPVRASLALLAVPALAVGLAGCGSKEEAAATKSGSLLTSAATPSQVVGLLEATPGTKVSQDNIPLGSYKIRVACTGGGKADVMFSPRSNLAGGGSGLTAATCEGQEYTVPLCAMALPAGAATGAPGLELAFTPVEGSPQRVEASLEVVSPKC